MASDLRIAFLTNLIPPYHKPLYKLLSQQYAQFRFFISTAMEANRPWLPEWAGLDVVPQKGLTFRQKWRHPGGFEEPVALHFPTDTVAQLSRFKPDVIVSVEMGFRTLLAYTYAKLHPKCRLIIWSEVTDLTESGRGKARQVLRRFLAKRVHGFLALGPGGVRYIHTLGAEKNKVFKIAYSTLLPEFTAIPIERYGAAATRLLFSGQFVERKGLRPFIDALAEWCIDHPDRLIEFTLLGAGPERSTLEAMSLPLNLKLTFVGTLQYHQLPNVYADSGILVLPTLADTWAVVVNEALASGVPVLGSLYSQAVVEMVEDGKTGWRFRPDHRAEMYNAIDRALLSTDAELNRMRVHARLKALEITPEKTAAVFEDAIRNITGRS